ncbi:hypothetical protein ZEAMMB73_Zm00001d044625 [Zea mays]|uniref:F-box protein n=1 Tax=Zea mays TaxID=4577 RepID=A0A1D6NQ45_MAIZE|nr:hypothetical protein ZEAMMB73_Zm00001d044625 [Zea mays]
MAMAAPRTGTTSAAASPSPPPRPRPRAHPRRPTPPLDSLADELLFLVLDRVAQADPRALKSFALASRACHAAESRHRRTLRPLRADLLPAALARYPSATRLDLTLARASRRPPSPPPPSPAPPPSAPSTSPAPAGSAPRASPRSPPRARTSPTSTSPMGPPRGRRGGRGSAGQGAAEALAGPLEAAHRHGPRMRRRRVHGAEGPLAQVVPWTHGSGIQLLALKCRKLTSLDLSYTMITKDSLPSIMKLPNLQELTLVGVLESMMVLLLVLRENAVNHYRCLICLSVRISPM